MMNVENVKLNLKGRRRSNTRVTTNVLDNNDDAFPTPMLATAYESFSFSKNVSQRARLFKMPRNLSGGGGGQTAT